MLSLIDDMAGSHPGRVRLVLSNTPTAAGIFKANARGIMAKVVDYDYYKPNSLAFELALQNHLEAYKIDLICLAGFMHILGSNFIAAWKGRILNIHPSLLPKYKGLNTHQRAIDAGDKEAGCTVHEVVTELDSGRILGRGYVHILAGETAISLASRVLVQEHLLYPKIVRNFIKSLSPKNSH
jgi:phosphoribosylglycinamide formyltransferase-1